MQHMEEQDRKEPKEARSQSANADSRRDSNAKTVDHLTKKENLEDLKREIAAMAASLNK